MSMINNKAELKSVLDKENLNRPFFLMLKKRLFFSDDYLPIKLQKSLRYYEYYMNKKKGVFDFLPYIWYMWNFRRLRVKTGIMLFPNNIQEGLKLVHPGFRRVGEYVHIGKNCTILPGVLLGKKNPIQDTDIYIGNDCYLGTGSTVLGPVTIGNNVTVGAGAVVTNDIPDNAVVGGVPAKIIKFNVRRESNE